MIDLTEDSVGDDVVIRHASATDVDVRPGDPGGPALVGVTDGALWARAEPSGPGIDIGHGALNLLVRSGTVLLDAQHGSGLVIVLRGEVEVSTSGEQLRVATAGDALTFDATGRLSDPDPVDAAELARDPFVSLNLVLDALAGAPMYLPDDRAEAPATPGPASGLRGGRSGEGDEPKRRRFGRKKG